MKSLNFASALVSGLFASALAISMVASTPALAQDETPVAKAKIPFAFQAGSQVMPAGTYTISTQSNNILLLRDSTLKAEEFIVVQSDYTTHTPKQSVIVFDRRGDKYFLRHIWTANNNSGLECPKSRAERQLEVARANVPTGTVALALNTSPKR